MANQSNFEKMKPEFKKETGQDWNKDVSVYISWFQAKMIEFLVNGYYSKNGLVLGK